MILVRQPSFWVIHREHLSATLEHEFVVLTLTDCLAARVDKPPQHAQPKPFWYVDGNGLAKPVC